VAQAGPLETLATALSAAVIALFFLAAILGLKAWRGGGHTRFLVLAVTSVAALELATGPLKVLLPPWCQFAVHILGLFNVAALWWFCLSLMRENFRLKAFEWFGAFVFSLGPLSVAFGPSGEALPGQLLTVFSSTVPFAMIAHLVWTAAAGLSDDLVAGRRVARIAAPLVLICAAMVSVLSEQLSDPVLGAIVRNGLATGPAAIWLLFWLTSVDLEKLTFERQTTTSQTHTGLDPRDAPLHASLIKAMEQDHLYQDHDVNLEQLADHLKTPVHRLRRLINQSLGFRNFSTFINLYRIAHARTALADPARARDSVLVIAYESGFAVLQTFNRVFKDMEDVTPKAFRARALHAAVEVAATDVR
jgi:AraC-like DNA-binding protein